jgi:cytochrome c-type biogenesis protein CcmE
VLAKHDENYMAPEAADALAKARAGQSSLVLPEGTRP